jgi:hypothetical protein
MTLIIMLTYDIIIKHLMPPINTFSLQSNIVMKSSDFPFFSKLFDDTFYRFGINNNSLINCVNYCFNTDINDNDAVKELDINIIVFDFKNNKIEADYKQTKFDFLNPWKPTLLLAKYENWWEPIVCKDTKIFSFNSPKSHILKNNIFNQNITKYNSDIEININDNFQEILDIEGFNKLSDNSSDIDDNSNETFITKDIKKEAISLAKLNKMKKEELEELCKKMNKVINKTKYTKKDLIDIINN